VQRAIVLFSLGFCFLVASCFPQFHSWRQKLTVEVATPAGDVSGSAVVQVDATFLSDPPLGTNEVNYNVTGEATVVEVAPGRYLFALVSGSETRFYGAAPDRFVRPSSFPDGPPVRLWRGEWLREIPRQTEPVSLLPDHVPMLVTFDDITRPETVRQVDPRDLDAAFGCDREPAASVLPWRAAGQVYEAWVADEAERLATPKAVSARAGFTGEVAAALEEIYRLALPDGPPADEGLARRRELDSIITQDQVDAWFASREALLMELPATLPSPEAVAEAWGGPCHRLAAVELAITDEPVTMGHLPPLFPWWPSRYNQQLDGDRYGNIFATFPIANSLNQLDFVRINQ
jgi:hypothetical protein